MKRSEHLREALFFDGDWAPALEGELGYHLWRQRQKPKEPIRWDRSPAQSALDGLLELLERMEAE